MKLTELAALVQIRNHISVVINDKSVTNRNEFTPLNSARILLDKKFVEIVKSLDTNDLFEKADAFQVVRFEKPSTDTTTSQVNLWRQGLGNSDPVDTETNDEGVNSEVVTDDEEVTDTQEVVDEVPIEIEKVEAKKPALPSTLLSPEDDPAFKAALAKQKAMLAAQGRSNKRQKKNNAEG